MESRLINALQDPSLYPHGVEEIRMLETHISWIILTGSHAYKLKKPLDLGFLDFRHLESRRFYCEEELRLNRRLAETIYEAVIPITGTEDAPVLNGEGEPIEYALRMRQFDPEQALDKLSDRGELTVAHLDALADRVAAFHQSVPALDPDNPMGDPARLRQAMLDNFTTIRETTDSSADRRQADVLQAWTESTFEQLEPRIQQRLEDGHVRECHGDLHLGNIAWFEDRITVFDCIEFNETFRWIDTANDLAFLLMDLESRGHRPWAYRVLNRYLEYSGDFGALPLLGIYKAYRAMIRAKVALLSPADTPEQQTQQLEKYRSYAGLAERYCEFPGPWLAVTTGFSASGKSHVSGQLAEHFGMIRIRSDVERKRLFNLGPTQSSESGRDSGIYTREATEQTYEQLEKLTREALMAGFPVIVDSAALRRDERESLHDIAEALGLPGLTVSCEAPEAVLRERIRERARQRDEVSEATEAVLDHQLETADPISESESTHTVHIRTDQSQSLDLLIQAIEKHGV
ncbi:hypothetical protein DES49_0712 [Halospina denitrificans]|uniref:Aminoglycoside phosphotransferase domain-containing protein n=1 Tax=Halospina denitrificans TaxID=332522 RepID=A0A4R7K4N4_9GAMM|nr:bifunctional aminoglycoside phosphotransferase/ATP-binding protein [Halospina denitrificans]TDT44599.1 hypothetical protein DES49_0712 [Halospina denitrificans]